MPPGARDAGGGGGGVGGGGGGHPSPLAALAMPGAFLLCKYSEFRQKRRDANSRRVTERELQSLHNKINATNTVVEDLRSPVMEAACGPLIPLLGAHAIKRLVLALCAGLSNKNNVLINAFIASDLLPSCRYLASPVLLGSDGVKRALNIPKLSDWELNELSKALWRVNAMASAGEQYAKKLFREQEQATTGSKPEEDPNVLRAALRRKGLMSN